MKQYKILTLVLLLVSTLLFSCKKDLYQANIQISGHSITLTSSIAAKQPIILTSAVDSIVQLTLSWTDPKYFTDTAKGNVVINYILDMDTSSTFKTGRSYNLGTAVVVDSLQGLDLNNKLLSIGCTGGNAQTVYARVKSAFYGDTVLSNTISFIATPYKLPLPALLVIGYSGWVTPTTRTNGYILTSANKNNLYEGYVNFSYASWGGADCRLLSTVDNAAYGWGTDAYTIQKFADISSAWNLWITPCPNYMKVNVDLSALTINYVPIQFYISGSFNNWGNTPLTFNTTTNQWTVSNVTFAAGDVFAFISSTWDATSSSWTSPSWDISYRVDASGNFIYGGAPGWNGNNITVNKAGTYTVVLDLSGGDGNYTYSLK